MRKQELETPALLVDQGILANNVKEMQQKARDAGVDLRPHTKTHKCPQLAKMQLTEGASGICVQKLGEAEVMAEAGIQDIFITNQIVQLTKIERLVKLEEKANVKVAVDSLENVKTIAKFASSAARIVPVFIEIDVGMGRCGVPFGSGPVRLAKEIVKIDGVHLEGLMTHEGHLYHVMDPKRRDTLTRRAIGRYVATANKIRKAGIEIPVVSCGSTPTATCAMRVPGITEIQPGNYVFYDLMQVELGVTKLANCAQRVLATIISNPSPNRIVVDAGVKAFCHDQCKFPKPLGVANATPNRISEEHLIVKINPRKTSLQVGEKVEFIPYHACTATNMYDQMHIVKGDEIEATWPVAARGKII